MVLGILVPVIIWLVSDCRDGQAILITNVIPGDGGYIGMSPLPVSDDEYARGTRVTLEARPAPGFRFVRWSGDAGGTINPIVITMDKDKNIVAEFE